MKTTQTLDLPTRVLLRMWFAQFWRFALLEASAFAYMRIAAMLTALLFKVFADTPASQHLLGVAAFYAMLPSAIWAWIRAFCGVLNCDYGGYRIVVTKV